MFIARPAFAQATPIHNPMKPAPVPVTGVCARTWHDWPRYCVRETGHEDRCKVRLRLRDPWHRPTTTPGSGPTR